MSNRENDCGICGNGNGTCPHNRDDDLSKDVTKLYTKHTNPYDEVCYQEFKKVSNTGAQGVNGIEGNFIYSVDSKESCCNICSSKEVCKYQDTYKKVVAKCQDTIRTEYSQDCFFMDIAISCKYYKSDVRIRNMESD